MPRYSRELFFRPGDFREDVRRALRAAGVRPSPKACYANAARVVVFQDEVDLSYVEGYHEVDGTTVAHAWVRTSDGVDHDITLRGPAMLTAVLVLSKPEAARRMAGGTFGPWREPEGGDHVP